MVPITALPTHFQVRHFIKCLSLNDKSTLSGQSCME